MCPELSEGRFFFRLARLSLSLILATVVSCQSGFAENRTDVMAAAYKAMDEQDWDTALDNFNRAKAMDSRDPTCRSYLGEIYRKMHRFTEAECEWEALKNMDPKNPQWRYEMAQTYVDQGKYRQALPIYQDLSAANTRDAGAVLGLGICLEGSGDIDSAKEYYDRTIAMAPQSRSAQSAQDRLERLTSALSARQSNQFFPIDPELGEAGLGWWDLSKMPVHVYIDDGYQVPGYRELMRSQLIRALDIWTQASGRHLNFVVDPRDSSGESSWKRAFGDTPVLERIGPAMADVPDDPVQSSLHVHWVESLNFPPPHKGQALGLAWTSKFSAKAGAIIKKAHLWIATNRLADGAPMPDRITPATANLLESQNRMIQEVMIHELGHCLGLTHSPNPNDIMASGIYGLNAVDLQESRQLSQRDLKSLAQHYNDYQGNGLPAAVVASKDENAPHTTGDFALKGVNTSALGQGWTPGISVVGLQGNDGSPGNDCPPPQTSHVPEDINNAVFEISCAEYASCVQRLNKFLQANPSHVQAHYLLAVAYVKMRRYSDAAQQYRQVLRLAPRSDIAKLAEDGLKKIKM